MYGMSKSSMAIGICPIELFHRALNLERERLPNNMSHDLNAQLRSPSTISYMKKSQLPVHKTLLSAADSFARRLAPYSSLTVLCIWFSFKTYPS